MSNETYQVIVYYSDNWIIERSVSMKKIFLTMILLGAVTPAFAVCSITGGACSVLDSPTLQDKHIPNNLENLQKPDAFQPNYINPYYDMLINTETNSAPTGAAATPNYNSNCQFGVCLPGENIPDVMPEF